jgi:3-keto-disaccharide hydrolase
MHYTRTAALVAALVLPAVAPADTPFNGKNIDNWKAKHPDKGKWLVGKAGVDEKSPNKLADLGGGSDLINLQPGSDLFTEQKYGDCTVELEFLIPKGSNSGVYLMGEYEVQIYDTFNKKGKDPKPGDMAGIYTFAPPKVFADKGPGVWQKFVIDFQAPKFEGGKKVSNAKFLKVTFNDVLVHENVECDKPTPGGLTGKEAPEGPLMFQGDHGQVAYRHVKVTPKK